MSHWINELMNQFLVGSSSDYDALIVGAGPSGASAAIHLAQAGARVCLVEAKRFPRAKLCGEFISPECLTHFEKLGALKAMRAANGARIIETKFYSPRGGHASVPSAWFGSTCALGLSRAEMDARLLERARGAGADVWQEARAVRLLREGEIVRGAFVRRGENLCELRAKVTIDATGRARALARLCENSNAAATEAHESSFAQKRNSHGRKRAPLVAFKAHLVNARGERNACEIYFYAGGYGGLSRVENDLSNLCFIVSARDAQRINARSADERAERIMREVVCQNARAAETLKDARVVTKWQTVALERFGRSALAPACGLLTIGDAAAFVDPFTGSGMLMALESGELAARSLACWLALDARGEFKNENATRRFSALADDYEKNYQATFDRRLRVCSWLRRVAFAPSPFIEIGARLLNANSAIRRALALSTRRAA